MYRLFAFVGVLAVAVAFLAQAEAKDDKVPSIDDIMKKAHGAKGFRGQIAKAVTDDAFDKATKPMDEWSKLAPLVGKNKPPKGTDESWKKLTGEYEKQVKDLAAAVKAKKAADADTALKAIGKGCKACHDSHSDM